MSSVFVHRLRVTYASCTLGNHVYYSRYLDFLEEARGELFRHLGRTFVQWQEAGLIFPVLEVQVLALGPADAARDGQYHRVAVRLIGLDALLAPTMAPALIPHPAAKLRSSSGQSSALAGLLFAPDTVFLNAAAERALSGVVSSSEDAPTGAVSLQIGDRWRTLRVAGGVRAPGPPLAVMDIAAAQDLLGRTHRITRVDLRLHPDVAPRTWLAAQQQAAGWPAQTTARIGSLEEDRAAALSAAALVNPSFSASDTLFEKFCSKALKNRISV